jgi:hypothetical protein
MVPSAVREALGAVCESFKRTPQSDHPCDYFPKLHCFVYYDKSGKAEAAELVPPAEPTLGGINLLGLGFAELVERIRIQDAKVAIEPDGFTSLELGVGCYAPSAEEDPENQPDSVIVFKRGYYD